MNRNPVVAGSFYPGDSSVLTKQINNYLISCDLNDLIIITPTTHKLYYEGIDNFLKPEKKVV